MWLRATRKRVEGPATRIHCPHCGAQSVFATSYMLDEKAYFLLVLPVARIRNTFVKCNDCSKETRIAFPLEDLHQMPPDALLRYQSIPTSFIASTLAVLSILLWWAPIVGFVVALFAVFANRRSSGWRRVLPLWGFVLSIGMLIFCLIIMAIE